MQKFSLAGGKKKGAEIPEEADFSLDSSIRQSLLRSIKKDFFCKLEDDELMDINAAGIPYPVNKQPFFYTMFIRIYLHIAVLWSKERRRMDE